MGGVVFNLVEKTGTITVCSRRNGEDYRTDQKLGSHVSKLADADQFEWEQTFCHFYDAESGEGKNKEFVLLDFYSREQPGKQSSLSIIYDRHDVTKPYVVIVRSPKDGITHCSLRDYHANGELSFYGGFHSRESGMAEFCGCDSFDQSAS